ncbi:hypothetical protein DFJ67_6335 [Asanoa ferruginea]|uniref:Uncharacterized protein n=1 Tax=Asanoa ferruginea TaxID=53367 RepID=A0A3D9ZW13_9ACTN|nr:hypothetical protein [Asanoa ferruginea]REG00284.1 hypothetical protein DFJ67_6335 [Asanoa ferruginea]GIF52127.1 hypothetical protein Afe04nite_66660 [Asanoa ferruginea]
MTDSLRIRLDVTADVDDDVLARMTGDLRDELLDLDVDSVERPSGGPAPDGTKAGEVLTAGALLLAVAPSVVEGVLAVLTSWLSRQPSDVTIEIDGQTFTGPVTREQRDALVAAYLSRVDDARP